ncbi:MOSC domain-containing protein [Mesorhizobium sp. SP-1A]|uniref:MOSC domain-containing protein n=1 Tax=Mesorhizobium sp. SP-1A TaxID=3077840 RepID=UPI0028F6E73F|nr:MOSC domain-containing protein [Mesorhizobium sp. SP-1A]
MADLGRVIELWRYPVSSLGGESVPSLPIGHGGADGDRIYGLVDAASGEIASPDRNPKWHGAPHIRGRLGADRRLEVAMPGGGWLPAPDPATDRALSGYLGFGVAIRPFEAGLPAGYDGPLSTPRYDKAAVHLLTTASLARLKALYPEGNPDRRRFRPTMLVDVPPVDGSFPETEWIGRRLAIGGLELTIVEPCRRCGFTIIAQQDVESDAGILRSLVRHNRHNLGVYCRVDRPGRVEVGDAMRFL